MADVHDMTAARGTYEGLLRLFKFGIMGIVPLVFLVIYLLAK